MAQPAQNELERFGNVCPNRNASPAVDQPREAPNHPKERCPECGPTYPIEPSSTFLAAGGWLIVAVVGRRPGLRFMCIHLSCGPY
jgi:hypothetical protein